MVAMRWRLWVGPVVTALVFALLFWRLDLNLSRMPKTFLLAYPQLV